MQRKYKLDHHEYRTYFRAFPYFALLCATSSENPVYNPFHAEELSFQFIYHLFIYAQTV